MNTQKAIGIGLTALLATVATLLAKVPGLTIVGPLILAIVIGMIVGNYTKAAQNVGEGIAFSSKVLLRAGIILLGLRLNFFAIQGLGISGLLYAIVLSAIAFLTVYGISRKLRIDPSFAVLLAGGTAICGAAAIAAIAPVIKAQEKAVAFSIATIALLGTFFTLIYTGLYPLLLPQGEQYGIFVGGTLHEIAHVVAASSIGGIEAENHAIIVKMLRVMLLLPLMIFIMWWFERKKKVAQSFSFRKLPIPWFVFGFLAMSLVQTFGFLHENVVQWLLGIAYFLLAMAMAGLGLNVKFRAFQEVGPRLFLAGIGGTIVLVLFGALLIPLLF
ncbi:YeiH family protein [Shouchella miscanthi]|uniref:Sulfate exporter family transporter n=1 Tax=Shouchella miscanthi TaxID=2598861 RepID=A0ABU6NPE7_9BACI|nr:putative sulfate exporter family transporter [Shouchella miscanthi]MED4129293.1 putative sulfate exporter family transporter [Shouchella miscanthi]